MRTPKIVAALLEEGVEVKMRLSGFSMKPLVRSGDSIWFSARLAPEVGDIVLVRHPNDQLVAHRVLRLDGEKVWTKGDSCRAADAAVPRSRLLACATALQTRGELKLPLRNAGMRTLGLLLSFAYPKLVRTFRTFFPRKDALSCAN